MNKLYPRCMDTRKKAPAFSASGYFYPCCWCDNSKSHEFKNITPEHLHIDNVENLTDIFLSKEWNDFFIMLKENPENAPTVCKKKCGKNAFKSNIAKWMDNINILTLKVGDKYSAEYVNKLYLNIKKNTKQLFNFYCYTENPVDLNPEIKIILLDNPDDLQLQWHKLKFHQTGFGGITTGEKCLILDIDWIIINNLDEILSYNLPKNKLGCFERWWSNLRHFCKLNGGFQMFYMGETNYLWKIFNEKPDYWQKYYIENGFAEGPVNGEQNFIDQHAKNKHWLPMEWFAKYEENKWIKINRNWERDVNPYEPYYMGGDFAESIKMVHFSNSENLIHKTKEKWVKEYW